jgi:hypothetical protein
LRDFSQHTNGNNRQTSEKTGIRYQAIVKRDGHILKTKIFRLKRDAQAWAKSIEADQDRMESLDSPGAGMTLDSLIDSYLAQHTERIPTSTAAWPSGAATLARKS